MSTLLEVSQASVRFGGVRAVDDVSLTLVEGAVHGVVGPNGSGKTTLLNAVAGTQRLTTGSIVLGGVDVTSRPAHLRSRAGIARTFQTIKLLPTLTVEQNVRMGVEHTGRKVRPAEAAEKCAVAMERLGITRLARRTPEELSYGSRRRVEIARAVVADPTLLLLDEPLAGMNREERDDIAEVIGQLAESGMTQLVIEHDLRTLLKVCDHLFVMNSGRLIAEGDPAATAARADVREIYLGRRHVAS
jgi:branched-chain amino acid transport system ATP-binding protein